MSLRQRLRLKPFGLPLESEEKDDDNDDEDEDGDTPRKPQSLLMAFSNDSDSEIDSNDDEDDDDICVEDVCPSAIGFNPFKQGKDRRRLRYISETRENARKQVEDEENELIESLLMRGQQSTEEDPLISSWKEKFASLMKVDARSINADFALLVPPQDDLNGKKTVVKRYTKRKWSFGSPDKSWVKPLSFIAGGFKMIRQYESEGEIHFSFVESEEYISKRIKFEELKELNDINLMGLFLIECPYFVDALLQFVHFFISFGDKERAHTFCKRILWIFECVSIEGFNPCVGNCRLDSTCPLAIVFLNALFLHMKLCFGMGLYRTSAAIGQTIFSLDPYRDHCCMLLYLDGLYLHAGQFTKVSSLYFLCTEESYECPVLVGKLPSWVWSVALSEYLIGNRVDGSNLLIGALKKYPVMVKSILQSTGGDGRCLIGTCFCSSTAAQEEVKLFKIYVIRNAQHWKRDDIHQWLIEHTSKCCVLSRQFDTVKREIEKYTRCNTSDFEQDTIVFPADANPLDPMFLDPAIFDGSRRLNRGLQNQIEIIREQHAIMRHSRAEEDESGLDTSWCPNMLDPRIPLVQMFWQSILPWNQAMNEEEALLNSTLHPDEQ